MNGSEPRWVHSELIDAIHSMQIAEHGGSPGVRDTALLEAALNRAKHKFHYNKDTEVGRLLFDLAAAYSYGIIKNHPFIDGNKRTAFVCGVVFLELNGENFNSSEPEAAFVFERLAASEVSETELALWFKENCK